MRVSRSSTTTHFACKFQGGGIVCLDHDETGWFIRWTLTPQIE